jgi:hypothetical protein
MFAMQEIQNLAERTSVAYAFAAVSTAASSGLSLPALICQAFQYWTESYKKHSIRKRKGEGGGGEVLTSTRIMRGYHGNALEM